MQEEKAIYIIKKILLRLQKFFWHLIGNPVMVLFLIIIFCIFLSLFYFFMTQQKRFHESPVVEINQQKYSRVLERWAEDERIVQEMTKEDYFNLFSTVNIDYEPKENLKENELVEDFFPEDNAEKALPPEEIEDLLARTLFEFYQEKEEDMPQIEERAQIWETLGLGDAEEYRGLYQQNILFLEALKEKMKSEN